MNELAWSKSRYRTFCSCRREWFLHYVAARDAWRDDATEEERNIRFCKKLTRLEWYFHRIFRDVLHRERGGSRAVEDALWRRWRHDRAYGNEVFQEVFYGETGAVELAETGISRLRENIAAFRKSELAQWLDSPREIERHVLELPLSFPVGEVAAYTAAFALCRNRETWFFIELVGGRMAETAALHRYYAYRRLQLPAVSVRSCFYDLDSGEMVMPEQSELNFTAAADNVCREATEMAAASPEDVTAAKAYLALPENRKRCGFCRFRAICR
ncbi:MAG: hypothetical protein AB7F40_04030 [Victivallaceae bacterium]|nr:hypothetical protein [Victivallaceae bacterium]